MFIWRKDDVNGDGARVGELAKVGADFVSCEHGFVIDPNDISTAKLIVGGFETREEFGGTTIRLNRRDKRPVVEVVGSDL